MAFTQDQINLLKNRFKSYKDNAPYMRLVFDLKTGGQKAIETPYITKITKSNAFNQVGRATIEISAIGGKYNYLLDPEWKGVINQKHQKITIVEGYGTWREISFIGYITGWDMEADGDSEVTIKIECVNRLLDINNSIYKGMGLDGSLSSDEIRDQMLNQAQYDIEAKQATDPYSMPSFDFSTDPYEAPTGFGSSTENAQILESWSPFTRLVRNPDLYSFKYEFTRQGLLLHSFMRSSNGQRGLTVYDIVNKKMVDFPQMNIDDYGKLVTNQRKNTAVLVGLREVVYVGGTYVTRTKLDSLVMMDFDKKEWKHISVSGPVLRPTGDIKGIAFYDNELYVSAGGSLLKTVIDFENGTATQWEVLASLYSPNDYNDLGSRAQGNVVVKGTEIVVSVYAKEGGGSNPGHTAISETRYYDYLTGELLETKTNKSVYGVHAFYNGYWVQVDSNEKYRILSLDFTEEYTTNLYKIPSDSPYSFSKDYALFNNELYMFPANFATSSVVDYDFVVFKTKLKFSNDGLQMTEINPAYLEFLNQATPSSGGNSPSQQLFNEAELQLPQMSYPTNSPTLPLLQDIATDSGQNLYAISQTGQTLMEYPAAKAVPDYTFDTSIDVLSLKHTKSSEIYDQVIVYFGKGNSASMVQIFRTEQIYPGQGGSVYKIMKPNMNKTQAENFAKRVIENGLSEELEVSARTVPNLTIGMTVLVNDTRMVGTYKGVVMQEETDNALDSGYYAKYKVLRFEG